MCGSAHQDNRDRHKILNNKYILTAQRLLKLQDKRLSSELENPASLRMEAMMKYIVKSIGDREIAWVMLAIAAMAVWSTWGIIS